MTIQAAKHALRQWEDSNADVFPVPTSELIRLAEIVQLLPQDQQNKELERLGICVTHAKK